MTPETIGRYRILKQLGAGRQANAVDEGLAELARTSQGREADPYIRFNRAGLQAAKGNRAEALPVAAEFERLSASNPVWATLAARIYMALGDYDRIPPGEHRSEDASRWCGCAHSGRGSAGRREGPPV